MIRLWYNIQRCRSPCRKSQLKMNSMHHWRGYPHPAPDKQACRSLSGVFEVDSNNKLSEPHLIKLQNYDARCYIITLERYRSGHNGADSKSVCANAHEGSNPSLSAKARRNANRCSVFVLLRLVKITLLLRSKIGFAFE